MSRTRDSWNEWMGRIIGRDNCFEGLSLRHDEGGGEKKEGRGRGWLDRIHVTLIVFRLMDGFRCKMLIDAIKTSRTAFPACDSPRYSRHTAIVAPQMRKGRGSFYSPFKASNNGPSSKGLIQNNFITIMRQFSFYRIFHGFLRFHGKGWEELFYK